MSYLSEAPESAERSALYADEVARLGYVANYTRVFGERPAVYRAWLGLASTVLSATGAEPDAVLTGQDPALVAALTGAGSSTSA
jgi:hypothetical protein